MKWKNIARLRATGGRAEKMLCCGRRKVSTLMNDPKNFTLNVFFYI